MTENEKLLQQEKSKITISKEKVVGDETEKSVKEKKEKKKDQETVSVSQSKTENKQRYYTIQPGDTLVRICMEQFQSLENMDKIMEINHITDENKIVAGQKIKLWEE